MRSLNQPRKIVKEYQDFTSVFEDSSEYRTTMKTGDGENRMSDARGTIKGNKVEFSDSPTKVD
jgi:hypothetical protein